MKSSRRAVATKAFVAMAVVVALILGLASGVIQSTARRGLTAAGLLSDGGASTLSGDRSAAPAAPSAPVLVVAGAEPGSAADRVAQRIAGVGPVKGDLYGQVIDAASGAVLYQHNPEGPATPASTLKVLTCLAALDAYGPGHRFETTVAADPAAPGRIWLVGGGDPYLAKDPGGDYPQRESIRRLARQAAERLRGSGSTEPVELVVDNSRFAGPSWNPEWIEDYRTYVSEVSALWVDEGRLTPNAIGPRDPNPAARAAKVFAEELGRAGVPVGKTSAGVAPSQAKPVASVASMPLENIVEQILIHSDNDAAEILHRQVGRTGGRTGSLADSQAAMQETLTRLGAWTPGMRNVDGSGLARGNLASAVALNRAVQLATAPEHPQYRSLLTGLAVAGVEGTLAGRFSTDGTEAGRGMVRAKTGTLTKVHSLAGYVRDRDGAILVYSFLVNGEQEEYKTRVWLDKVTTALSTCGCRA